MFKYNNTHIFTGYLKQLLSTFSLPTCKVYTSEFVKYRARTGQEDPRVLKSFDAIVSNAQQVTGNTTRINYIRSGEVYSYFVKKPVLNQGLRSKATWQKVNDLHYTSDKVTLGLTRSLNSPGIEYDAETHSYLGDYLRFLRDYHDINLMSLYNCFTNKICNNLYYKHKVSTKNSRFDSSQEETVENPKYFVTYSSFDSQDTGYRIYAIPVKLFANYTIAIDSSQGIELFCGLYSTTLDMTNKAKNLINKTYLKLNKTTFGQPFLYDKLSVDYWSDSNDLTSEGLPRTDMYTRWDITNREKDLCLFIKVPSVSDSSIVVLEGDFRTFNDTKYAPDAGTLTYRRNHSVINFSTAKNTGDGIDLNNYSFKPISKLQLLAFNTGESYPFADRLVEYLSGSAITPIDEIPDNIKRVQRVMRQNKNYFKIEGLWENKMQNILYDYMINAGPIEVKNDTLKNRHSGNNPKNYGTHPKLGYTMRSTQYDILGYVDKDTEKLYASWKKVNNQPKVSTNLQNIDIYDGLYDI